MKTFGELEREAYVNDEVRLNAFVAHAYELEAALIECEKRHDSVIDSECENRIEELEQEVSDLKNEREDLERQLQEAEAETQKALMKLDRIMDIINDVA